MFPALRARYSLQHDHMLPLSLPIVERRGRLIAAVMAVDGKAMLVHRRPNRAREQAADAAFVQSDDQRNRSSL
ncbi:MAG: hypothetical protein U0359_37005 [Byssovorax sp.]